MRRRIYEKIFKGIFVCSYVGIWGKIFVSCGKKELTGLHKEFDIIFNGIKEEVTTEFKNNLDALEKEVKDSSRSELETKIQLFGIEVLVEAFNKASYDVVSINDMGDKAELKIKVKAVDFFEALQQIITNTTKDKSNLVDEVEGLLKKIKKGKAPVIEQEMDIEMTKENDTWTIPERQKYVLMKRMMGIQKGSIFDN